MKTVTQQVCLPPHQGCLCLQVQPSVALSLATGSRHAPPALPYSNKINQFISLFRNAASEIYTEHQLY